MNDEGICGETDSYIEVSVNGESDLETNMADDKDIECSIHGESDAHTDKIDNIKEGDDDKNASKSKRKKKYRKGWIGINTSNCKYDSVRRVARKFGLREVGEDDDWSLYWTDCSVALERVMDMKRYQKINHFPGMSEVCRKDLLVRNMNRLYKLFPNEYKIFPRSWCLPADYSDLMAYSRNKKNKTYIIKPENSCQGKGIYLVKNVKDIKPNEHSVCQRYLSKPYLLDGYKFDLRIYVLVTSCDPLRIFVYEDGLVRLATTTYIEPTNGNVDNAYMHLTNYAINKNSKDFVRDDECGSKRKLTTLNKWFKDNKIDVDEVWRDIEDVIIKTLITAHPILVHNYRTCFPNHNKGCACFEILGFDIILDKKLKPWLLEVNHSPSFHTDAKLDKEVKEGLLYEALCLLQLSSSDRRKCIEEDKRKVKERLFKRQSFSYSAKREEAAQHHERLQKVSKEYEDKNCVAYRRIYPEGNEEKYERFFVESGSLFQETAASRSRRELAKAQREEIKQKQAELESFTNRCKSQKMQRSSSIVDGLRPESPTSVRPVKLKQSIKRPITRPTSNSNQAPKIIKPKIEKLNDIVETQTIEEIDTSLPIDIEDEEESNRIASMLQRDQLVRSTGIVDLVRRLLAHIANSKVHARSTRRNSQEAFIRLNLLAFDHEVCGSPTKLVNGDRPSSIASSGINSWQGDLEEYYNKYREWSRLEAINESHRSGINPNNNNKNSNRKRFVNTSDLKKLSVLLEVEEENDRLAANGDEMNQSLLAQSADPSKLSLLKQKSQLLCNTHHLASNHATHLPIYVPITASQYINSTHQITSRLSRKSGRNKDQNYLSIVSSPAPVGRRPEVASRLSNFQTGVSNIDRIATASGKLMTYKPFSSLVPSVHRPPALLSKPTRTQRARNALNNIKLKQLELQRQQLVTLNTN